MTNLVDSDIVMLMRRSEKSSLIDNFNKRNSLESCYFLTLIFMVFLAVCVSILSFFINRTLNASEIFDNSIHSIVEIRAYKEGIGESLGTAEFINKEGILITNAHVVTYSKLGETLTFDKISIRFACDENFVDVELVKYNTEIDIAVLKMSETKHKFKPLKLGDASIMKSGDKVYAIGNSAGYGLSMAEGVVGIPQINIKYDGKTRKVIQSSINITDGNSGGALLDEYGNLVGITSFRTRDLNGNVIYGISYSVPINTVVEYINN